MDLLVLNKPHLFVGVVLMLLAVVSIQGPNQGYSFFDCSQLRSLGMIQSDVAFSVGNFNLCFSQ
jgi:hypothetical protein